MTDYRDYQKQAIHTKIYKDEVALPYLFLGLIGEVGELIEKVKAATTHMDHEGISKEAGDVSWYVAGMCDEFDYNINLIFLQELGAGTIELSYAPDYNPVDDLESAAFQLAELGKKYLRDEYPGEVSDERHKKITIHLTMIMHCVRVIVDSYTKYDFDEVLGQNIQKLASRKDRDVLTGSGDNR